MKRYTIDRTDSGAAAEDPNGDWVRYEDVQPLDALCKAAPASRRAKAVLVGLAITVVLEAVGIAYLYHERADWEASCWKARDMMMDRTLECKRKIDDANEMMEGLRAEYLKALDRRPKDAQQGDER